MKTITIRRIDDQLAELLKQKAHNEQKSVNQLLLDTLRNSLGLSSEKRFTAEFHDLDHLFGQWSEEEFTAIQGKISKERRVDQELWQ
ncbi:MAG: antitoxin [Pseudomonadota bacterium]